MQRNFHKVSFMSVRNRVEQFLHVFARSEFSDRRLVPFGNRFCCDDGLDNGEQFDLMRIAASPFVDVKRVLDFSIRESVIDCEIDGGLQKLSQLSQSKQQRTGNRRQQQFLTNPETTREQIC